MNRKQIIEDRLTTHFRDELSLGVLSVDQATWSRLELPPRFRFGWMPPVPMLADAMVVMFSAEMIDAVTADLPDDLLASYLDILEVVVEFHVVHRGLESDAIVEMAENELYGAAPDVLGLWGRVDASAIDRGLVPAL
jgi:hypothetical protein